MAGSKHIIDKVFLEINTRNIKTANYLNDNIGWFLNNEVFPEIELLFEKFDEKEVIRHFEKLELTVPTVQLSQLENIKKELLNQLEMKLTQVYPGVPLKNENETFERYAENGLQGIPVVKKPELVVLYFIENACLPWFGTEEHFLEWIGKENWKKSFENEVFFRKLVHLLNNEPEGVQRFVAQFPLEIILDLVFRVLSETKNHEAEILAFLKKNNPATNRLLMVLLLRIVIGVEPSPIAKSLHSFFFHSVKNRIPFVLNAEVKDVVSMVRILKKWLPANFETAVEYADFAKFINECCSGNDTLIKAFSELENSSWSERLKAEIASDEKEEDFSFFNKEKKEAALQNAGLILLNPFLKSFFEKTGITDENKSFSIQNGSLAVQALHFLATGKEDAFEGNLVMEKFLCGIPLKMPVEKQSLLTQEIKDESETLLKEVIRHWNALKNSSVNDLRHLFLQRNGKLMFSGNNYRLLLERQAQDILLERLPWNISMVKLPWIRDLIFVEW